MTSGRYNEQAPLLADDAPNDEADSVEDLPQANGKVPKREKPRKWLKNAWHWVWNNLMTTAIILLLLGGLIALLVYFAGMFDPATAPAPAKVRIIVSYNQESDDSGPVMPDSICLTPACVIAASKLLENMSPRYHEIDPCHDFDQFVCEGWQEKHDLRADQGSAFTGSIMAENSQQILRHLLESPYSADEYTIETDSSAKREIFEKLQAAYDACMDEGVIEELGSAPLLDILRNVEELFPAKRPDTAQSHLPLFQDIGQKALLSTSEDHLSKTLTYLTSIGMGPLVSFYIAVRSRRILSVSAKLIFFRLTTKIQMSSFLS